MNMLNDHTVHFFWLSQLQSGWNGWILQFFKTLRWRHHPVMFTTNFEEYNHDRFRSSRVTVSLLDHFSIHPGASAIGSLSLVPKWIPWEIGWSWILSSDTIVIDWGPKPWWYVIICLQQSNRSRYFCCFWFMVIFWLQYSNTILKLKPTTSQHQARRSTIHAIAATTAATNAPVSTVGGWFGCGERYHGAPSLGDAKQLGSLPEQTAQELVGWKLGVDQFEVGSLSTMNFLQGFKKHPKRWLFGISETSTVGRERHSSDRCPWKGRFRPF